MPNRCVVPNCRTGYPDVGVPEGIYLHQFPKDPDRARKWTLAIHREAN